MERRVSVDEARATLTDLLAAVARTRRPVIVEQAGEPVAVLVSPEDYNRLTLLRREAVERIRSRLPDRDPDEVLREVTEIVEEVRRERHEQRQRPLQSGD